MPVVRRWLPLTLMCSTLLTGCSLSSITPEHDDRASASPSASHSVGTGTGAAAAAAPGGDPSATAPAQADLPPGWDQPPDSPIVPDSALTQDEVDGVLQVTATGPDGAGVCPADAVTYGVQQL
ncbi:MAG: hypothetical protein KJ548_03030, partial [Actinobacteria bacterium]|nr:hypothetical protein [Actinomycetota bacterium]